MHNRHYFPDVPARQRDDDDDFFSKQVFYVFELKIQDRNFGIVWGSFSHESWCYKNYTLLYCGVVKVQVQT